MSFSKTTNREEIYYHGHRFWGISVVGDIIDWVDDDDDDDDDDVVSWSSGVCVYIHK